MDKSAALHDFFSGFGIPALDEQSAFDSKTLSELHIDFPYITYETAVGDFDEEISLSADLYYRSTSWAEIESKASEICSYIGSGGRIYHYGEGAMWVRKGIPTYQRMQTENTFDIRRIHLNIDVEFLTS